MNVVQPPDTFQRTFKRRKNEGVSHATWGARRRQREEIQKEQDADNTGNEESGIRGRISLKACPENIRAEETERRNRKQSVAGRIDVNQRLNDKPRRDPDFPEDEMAAQ